MPSTEDIKARMLLEQLQENAARIAPLLKAPDDLSPHNARVYRAVYVSHGIVVSAGISAMIGRPVVIAVHRAWSRDPQDAIQKFQGPTSPEEAAVFLGLDECYPRVPEWKAELFSESLLVVKGGLNGNSPL